MKKTQRHIIYGGIIAIIVLAVALFWAFGVYQKGEIAPSLACNSLNSWQNYMNEIQRWGVSSQISVADTVANSGKKCSDVIRTMSLYKTIDGINVANAGNSLFWCDSSDKFMLYTRAIDDSLVNLYRDKLCHSIECPTIMCTLFCENGFQKDINGCSICGCKETTTTTIPTLCIQEDVKQCSDGSFVSRDPTNNCEFKSCPSTTECSTSQDCWSKFKSCYYKCHSNVCDAYNTVAPLYYPNCEGTTTTTVSTTTTTILTTTTTLCVGCDVDEHGCKPSAGYSWCEAKHKCLRVFEESCTPSPNIITQITIFINSLISGFLNIFKSH